VDLIFSTATFHWIKDQDRLFRRLAQALKPQGRLVAQCGGKGNTARTQNAMEQGMGEGRFPKCCYAPAPRSRYVALTLRRDTMTVRRDDGGLLIARQNAIIGVGGLLAPFRPERKPQPGQS
jgi:SAM-dependent methyltransferase